MTTENPDADRGFVFDDSILQLDANGHPMGTGFYPSFPALWHLEVLGVADTSSFASNAWSAAETAAKANGAVRVAIIDTPIAWKHPNLKGAIDLGLMRDFSISNAGAFIVRDLKESPEDESSRQELAKSLAEDDTKEALAILAEIKEIANSAGLKGLPHEPAIFNAHGTALAGLVGARPATAPVVQRTDYGKSAQPLAESEISLPYAGINPFCRIVPISTTPAPDPDMVFAALRYARLIDADIVIVADSWDKERMGRSVSGTQAIDDKAYADGKSWADVEDELALLCKKAVVLCAAGNSGETALAYPASIAGNKKFQNLWAVTAGSEDGKELSYSAKPNDPAKTLIALSTEAPRFDRIVDLIDPWAIAAPDPGRPKAKQHVPARRIISLDAPGPVGYNPSPYRYTPPAKGPHLEVGSLFTEFSGTSAATAVAAGLISLAIQTKGNLPAENNVIERPETKSDLFDLNQAIAKFGT